MATTPALNLQWNNPLLCPSPQENNHIRIPFHSFRIRTSFGKLRAKCFFISNIRGSDAPVACFASITEAPMDLKTEQNPVELVVQTGEDGANVGPAVNPGSVFSPIIPAVAVFVLASAFSYWVSQSSVLKLQVGLFCLGRPLQNDLYRIGETASKSTSEGLHYVLTETIPSILRHPDCCISAYSSVDVKKSIGEVESRFNQLSLEERRKFDEETFVEVNYPRKERSTIQSSSGFSNEYIVITIMVAATGVHKLSSIGSNKNLKEALQKLASIPPSKIMAVEVLWTPHKENDTLSEPELLENYPLLRPL